MENLDTQILDIQLADRMNGHNDNLSIYHKALGPAIIRKNIGRYSLK